MHFILHNDNQKIDRKVGTLDFVFNLIYAIYTLSWKHICILWGLRSEARESKRVCCRLTRRRSSWRSWFGLSASHTDALYYCITVLLYNSIMHLGDYI